MTDVEKTDTRKTIDVEEMTGEAEMMTEKDEVESVTMIKVILG